MEAFTAYVCHDCQTTLPFYSSLSEHRSYGHNAEDIRLRLRSQGQDAATETQWSSNWRKVAPDTLLDGPHALSGD